MGVVKKVLTGWFDEENRRMELKRKNLPLERLNAVVDWAMFRGVLVEHLGVSAGEAGRPRYDVVLMLKILVLQRYYHLSDAQTELQIMDRLSFQQ